MSILSTNGPRTSSTCIDIVQSHLFGHARGFACLVHETGHGQFDGLDLETTGGRYDRFGTQNRGDELEDKWNHREACIEAKLSQENVGSV